MVGDLANSPLLAVDWVAPSEHIKFPDLEVKLPLRLIVDHMVGGA